jgi:CMP-N-acetylneuraminic acid synthetase
MARTIAIVPMRHNSERVPGKNYRPLAGHPLFHWVVKTLTDVPEIDQIVIDTDSPTVREQTLEQFPDVLVLERPEHLRDGAIAMNDVLLNTIEQVQADVVLQTHSTNPFLSAASIREGFAAFARDDIDSVFSVTPLQQRLWTADAQPINHDPAVLLRTQDLPPVMIENSCYFIFTPDVLRERGNRIGAHPAMVAMEPLEATDIDEESDFQLAEALAPRFIDQVWG